MMDKIEDIKMTEKLMESELKISEPMITMLAQSKSHAEHIINDFRDIFFVINEKGCILKSNIFGASLFQVSNEDILNKNMSEILLPEHWDEFVINLKRLKSLVNDMKDHEIANQVEFELPLKDGDRVIFWSIKPFSTQLDLKNQFFSIIGRDISVSILLEKNNLILEFQNNRIQAILDSALQGFLTYDQNMKIEKDYSKKAEELLGKNLAEKNICEVLNLNYTKFSEFTSVVYLGTNWDLLKNFSKLESEVNGKVLKTELVPIIEEGKVKRILAAVTDITQITELKKKAEHSAQINRMMVKILQSKSLFLDVIWGIGRVDARLMDRAEAKRIVHTWKGEFSFFDCFEFVDLCHSWEEEVKDNYTTEAFQKLLTNLKVTLESFLEQYDDLLHIRKTKKNEVLVSLERIENIVKKTIQLEAPVELLDLTEHLLESTVQECLSWLNEVWLTAAERLGKKVYPIEWKESVPIFFDPYKKLFSSLVHAVRNSADHGIEYPQNRIAQGKPKKGHLSVQLQLDNGMYHLKMRDDGSGLNPEKIQEIAKKRNIKIPDNGDVSPLLFEENFTTRDTVNEFSGRGVGLNAVKMEAFVLNGDAKIKNLTEGGLELHITFKKKTMKEIFIVNKE